nr:glycosyltransferase [bacterium]
MRVAIFSNNYHPMVSGVITHIDFIRSVLKGHGDECRVITARFPRHKETDPQVLRYPAADFIPGAHFPIPWPYSRRIWRQLEEFKPDIIHAQHPFSLGRTALRYAKRNNIPLVFTFHTEYDMYVHFVPLPRKWGIAIIHALVRSFCRQTDVILCPAASKADMLRSYGVNRPITLLPNGLDTAVYQQVDAQAVAAFKQKEGLEGKRVLLHIGRISKEKNLPFLLEAFALVAAARGDAVLVIAGDGPELDELREQARDMGLEGCVRFIGNVEHDRLPVLMNSAEAALFPMKTETLPMVCLEAMAAGLPAVVLDVPWTRDAYDPQQPAAVFAADDARDYAGKVLELLENTGLRAQLGVSGKAMVGATYDVRPIGSRLLKVYQALAGKGRQAEGKKAGRARMRTQPGKR